MEDFLKVFPGLCAIALVTALIHRVRAHTSRRVGMWFDKVTRRAYGEPPGVPLSPPGPPNLVVGAFVNLIWLSAIFILLAWATGSSLGGTQAGNQADLSGKVVLIRLGFGVLVLVVARWAIKTLVTRVRPHSHTVDDS